MAQDARPVNRTRGRGLPASLEAHIKERVGRRHELPYGDRRDGTQSRRVVDEVLLSRHLEHDIPRELILIDDIEKLVALAYCPSNRRLKRVLGCNGPPQRRQRWRREPGAVFDGKHLHHSKVMPRATRNKEMTSR